MRRQRGDLEHKQETFLEQLASPSSLRILLGNQKQPVLALGLPESLTRWLGMEILGDQGVCMPKP